jgi:hypothetical protein
MVENSNKKMLFSLDCIALSAIEFNDSSWCVNTPHAPDFEATCAGPLRGKFSGGSAPTLPLGALVASRRGGKR